MKVLVVSNMAPFVHGGAEELASHLVRNLIASGHDAEAIRIPFRWDPPRIVPSQMLLVRALEVWNVDRVIALKFPAYLIRHPNKTIWLLHQFRQAYDLFDACESNIGRDPEGEALRSLVKNADDETFRESRRIFTNSETTRSRLARYNGFDSEVLRPPLNDPEKFGGGQPKGYVFAGGRVNSMKRQALLIEAMVHAPRSVRLVIAGPPDSADDAERLRRLVTQYGLEDRVRLDLRFLSRDEIADYVNHSSACAYVPVDEDSLGYVAMEAANAAKPIVSVDDSGGVLDLVRDLETGWVSPPDPIAIASSLVQASTPTRVTRELGEEARRRWIELDLTWPSTIARLLA